MVNSFLVIVACVIFMPLIVVLVPVALVEWTLHDMKKHITAWYKEVHKDNPWYFIDEDK